MSTRTAARQAVHRALAAEDWMRLQDVLRDHPAQVRCLLAMLHDPDPERLERTLRAFAELPSALDRDRLADLARKLMWLLNEESGNHCPAAALALAAVGDTRPDVVEPHLPVLRLYAEDPSDSMAAACREVVRRVTAAAAKGGRS